MYIRVIICVNLIKLIFGNYYMRTLALAALLATPALSKHFLAQAKDDTYAPATNTTTDYTAP